MKSKLLFVFSGFFFSVCLFAADAKKAALPEYASLKKIKTITLAKGESGEASVEVEVQKGFHVQANPASLPNLIPTTLTIDQVEKLEIGEPVYPSGTPHKLQSSPGDIMAYDGTFAIKVPIKAAETLSSSKIAVTGRLRYQACNEKTCFFPVTVPVSIPVRIK